MFPIVENEHEPDYCVFCGNEIKENGLCKAHYDTWKWMKLAMSPLDKMMAAELVDDYEYSDDFFSDKNAMSKPKALFELYRGMNFDERKEFMKLLNNIGGSNGTL